MELHDNEPQHGMSEAELLNEAQLAVLAGMGSAEQFRSLLQLFVGQMERCLVNIQGAARAGDLKEVDAQAHDLAGTAGNFGAARVELIARAIMVECPKGHQALGPLLDDLLRACRSTAEALNTRYIKQPS